MSLIISEGDIISKVTDATKMKNGRDYFEALGKIISELAEADYTFITKIDSEKNMAHPLVSFEGISIIEDVDYSLTNTPCLTVKDTCVGFYPNNVQQLFPKDYYLKKLDIEGYIGSAIISKLDKKPLGLITCLYRDNSDFASSYLKIIELIAVLIQGRFENETLKKENDFLRKKSKDREN